MTDFHQQVAALCFEASVAILNYYNQPESLVIQQKQDNTPVTSADLLANKILEDGLKKILDIPIISEESGSKLLNCDDYWLIDPIDGTKEFIQKTGQFCIAIARIVNARPVFALIYQPTSNNYYYAYPGKGAYLVNQQEEKRIFSSNNPQRLRLITAQYQPSNRLKNFTAQILGDDFAHYRCGSALKFCEIASGNADFYPKLAAMTSEWDIAAGDLLLEESGGILLFVNGEKPLYGKNTNFLNPPFIACGSACKPEMIKKALQLLNELQTK